MIVVSIENNCNEVKWKNGLPASKKEKGVIWLDRKQKTVEKYGHSSYYIYLENEENKTYQADEKDESLVICGGGFPLIIHDELRGSILVSGLVHDEDHQVIVDCLRKLKDEGTCK